MKKLLKIALWIAGIFAVLIVLAIVGIKLFFPAEKLRQMAVERGSDMLGREITIEGMDLSVWGGLGLVLQKVTIASPPGHDVPPILAAENIDLKLQLFPLLSGEFSIDRLIIDQPRIYLHKGKDGANNYTFVLPDTVIPAEVAGKLPPEAQAAAVAVAFDEFEIVDGYFTYKDDSAGVLLKLDKFSLATSLNNDDPGIYASTGRISIDSVRLITDEPYPTFPLELSYAVEYDMTERQLLLEKASFGVNAVAFDVTGEVSDPTGDISAKINIKSDRTAVIDLFGLLPAGQLAAVDDFSVEGDFTLDVDIEYAAIDGDTTLYYSGTSSLTDLVMSHREVAGELRFSRCLLDFKPDNLRLNIEDGSFNGQPFKGHLVVGDFDDPAFSGELSGGFDLVFLGPFLPAEPAHIVSGDTKFDLKFSGRKSDIMNLSFTGNVAISNGTYNSPLVPEPIESFTLDAYFDNRLLNIKNLTCRFPSGDLNFKGRVNDLVPYLLTDSPGGSEISPEIEGSLSGQVDLALVNSYLPKKGKPELGGNLAVDVRFAGNIAHPGSIKPWGTMVISDAVYSDTLLPEPIEKFEAEFELRPDTITITNMNLKFVSSDVSLSGQLSHPFPYLLPLDNIDRSRMKRPFFAFTLTSTRFDIDKLFPEAVPGAGAVSGTGTDQATLDSVSMIILPDIDGRGSITADTVIYSRVELTDLHGQIRIKDRQIQVYDVTTKVYSGTASGRTTIDLQDFSNPRYTGEFSASQIEADDFINRFSKMGGHLFGKANLTGKYDAHGWDPDAFLNSLSVDGKGELREGKLVTSGVMYSFLNSLAKKTGGNFDREQPLNNLATKFIVKDGRVQLDQLTAALGSIGDLAIGGYYSFDGGLNYNGTLHLSEKLSKRLSNSGGLVSGLAGLLSDKKSNRIMLPLKITGTVSSPKPEFDYSALLSGKAGNLLEGLFKKKKKK